MGFSLYIAIVLCLKHSLCDEALPPGHLQPLGSHMAPKTIEELDTFPDALTFQYSYVQKNMPLKLNGLLKTTDVLTNWQSDEYLTEKFGDDTVLVDENKKENRTTQNSSEMKLSEFLNVYKERDVYAVSDLPQNMANEWPLPSFLLCGGYTENLAFIYMWLSSGGTSSVLHSDLIENLHCVVSGTKTFVLIDKQYTDTIGSEFASQGYYNIDVERVDMTRYPGLATVPWYKVVVESGDCLYLPYGWIHQVTSEGRNMGINVWWVRFTFNDQACKDMPNFGGFANAGQFQISSNIQIKGFLLDMQRDDGTIHATDVYETQRRQTSTPIELEHVLKAFDILQPDCGGIILSHQLQEVSLERLKQADNYVSSILQSLQQGEDEWAGPEDHEHHSSDEL